MKLLILLALMGAVSAQSTTFDDSLDWVRCIMTIPDDIDIVKYPDGTYVTYSAASRSYGSSKLAANGRRCASFTSNGQNVFNEDTTAEFYFLREPARIANQNGSAYELIPWLDVYYGKKSCYQPKAFLSATDSSIVGPCYYTDLPDVVTCPPGKTNTIQSLAGDCSINSNQIVGHAAACNAALTVATLNLVKSALVLCRQNVASVEYQIISVDESSLKSIKAPSEVLVEKIVNNAESQMTWIYTKTVTSDMTSTYDTEHGITANLDISMAIDIQLVNLKMTATHNMFAKKTTKSVEKKSETSDYVRTFIVEKRSNYTVTMRMYMETTDVRYTAKEILYDKDKRMIGQPRIRSGVWKGVATYAGDVNVLEVSLLKG